jgi:hypothetical protein
LGMRDNLISDLINRGFPFYSQDTLLPIEIYLGMARIYRKLMGPPFISI